MTVDEELRGQRVLLRPVTDTDRAAVRAIRSSPVVAMWWDEPKDDAWPLGEAGVHSYTVHVDGQVAGFVQWYDSDNSEFRHAGIDLFLAEQYHGQGLGQETVTTLLEHLVRGVGHHRVVIDPAASNTRAIACYRRCGFREVGVMRCYQYHPTRGTWLDGLLMEYVVDPEPRESRPGSTHRGRVAVVTVTDVTSDNWRSVAELDVHDEQRAFVAPVTRYLAMCAYDAGPWRPLAVQAEGGVVGFAMEAVDPADDSYWIGGLVVDAASQGRGIGRATVEALVGRARSGSRPSVALSYDPANTVARGLYASLGFTETGETDGAELVARLALQTTPPASS